MVTMLKSNLQPDSLYSAAQSRELDHIAMEKHGLNDGILMERAGEAAFRTLRFCWPRANKLLILAGPGNNGGDGFVVARLAIELGLEVKVVCLVDPDLYKGDAGNALKRLLETDNSLLTTLDAISSWQADVIIDAVFGTGLARAPAGQCLAAIQWMNNYSAPVLALDIPSGLSADTGSAISEVVQAQATLCFIGIKVGLVTGQGPQVTGQLYFNNLDLPESVYKTITPVARSFSIHSSTHLPELKVTTHKHKQGHVLVVGGDQGMAGAAVMAAEAAYRSGAGLVSIFCHVDSLKQIVFPPEVLVSSCGDGSHETCDKLFGKQLKKIKVVVLGPGLGQRDWSRSLFSKVLEYPAIPLVIDADGLRCLASNQQKRGNWVLTPHVGEAAALLETTTEQIESDRLLAARKITHKYGGVCVLKGAGSVIASEHETQPVIIRAGNPGMATAGMGDILSGLIAAITVQGLPLFESAQLATWLHARAADEAIKEKGKRGLMATDLFDYLARLEKKYQSI